MKVRIEGPGIIVTCTITFKVQTQTPGGKEMTTQTSQSLTIHKHQDDD